jgi:pSer/pThr/pTyr-binding forkhead associated (FHA) protein
MVGATMARLVVIARDGTEGASFQLGEVTDIGRSEGQIVVPEDRYLSPRHARVTFRGGVFLLSDLGSTNGLFVRIPFSPAAALSGQGQPQHGTQAINVERDPRAGLSKSGAGGAQGQHPLADQDLFLVGQQVLRFEVVNDTEQGFRVAFDSGTLLFGTPTAARLARLIQVGVEGTARDVFHVRKTETIIGRESGDIVFTDDPFLSRRHAAIRVHGGGADGAPSARRFSLADLGSSNGTFLQTRAEVVLKQGDQFRVGQQLFRFDLGGSRVDA